MVYVLLTLGSSTLLSTIFPLPAAMSCFDITNFSLANPTQIEYLISETPTRLAHMRHEPMENTKAAVPKSLGHSISSRDLLGRLQIVGGWVETLDNLDMTRKALVAIR